MNLATLIIDSVLLFGIVGVSVYGARVVPPGVRLPMHFGPGGYGNWQSRNLVLLSWPVVAVAIYVYVAVSARNHGTSIPVALTFALLLMLVNSAGAIRAALRRSGGPG